MNTPQNQRYIRQMVLPEVGPEGQQRFRDTRVLCVGAGGLGSPVLLYLAAAGIGTIGIIDADIVDISNLQRQVIYTGEDEGKPKATAAAERLKALNPEIEYKVYQERLTSENALKIFSGFDIIVDGTDNFPSKFLINDAAVKLGKPVVFGAILGFEGQLSVFWAEKGPCYRCLYPELPSTYIPNCAEAGVLGGVAGMVGTGQAVEVLKLALGEEICNRHGLLSLIGKLWILDTSTMNVRAPRIKKDPKCPLCSKAKESIILHDEKVVCAMDLDADVKALTAGEVREIPNVVMIDVREDYEWRSGRIPGALHIPLQRLLTDESALEGIDATAPIMIYCQHGIRSLTGANHLKSRAIFKSIYHLKGGLVCWDGAVEAG